MLSIGSGGTAAISPASALTLGWTSVTIPLASQGSAAAGGLLSPPICTLMSNLEGTFGTGKTPQQIASERGSELVKQFKKDGIGKQAGRSGGHGDPYKRAGAELIREANKLPKNDPLYEALKRQGQRLIEKGKSISHPGG